MPYVVHSVDEQIAAVAGESSKEAHQLATHCAGNPVLLPLLLLLSFCTQSPCFNSKLQLVLLELALQRGHCSTLLFDLQSNTWRRDPLWSSDSNALKT